jgi:hypothetical protein
MLPQPFEELDKDIGDNAPGLVNERIIGAGYRATMLVGKAAANHGLDCGCALPKEITHEIKYCQYPKYVLYKFRQEFAPLLVAARPPSNERKRPLCIPP